MPAFDELADELYLLPPADFVTVRTELAAVAKKAGDPTTASAITKLRKPTVSAWLLNRLAADVPDLLAGAIAIGPALREATEARDGRAIRDLSAHRRQLLRDLVEEARSVAREHGQAFTAEHEREIEASVTAAFTDEAAAKALTSRRLTAPLRADDLGFGSDDVFAAASPAPSRTRAPGPAAGRVAPEKDSAAERERRRADEAAEQERIRAVEAAEQALATARLQDADAGSVLEAAEQAVSEAESAERAAAEAHREAKAALSDARADRTAAKADAAAAGRAVQAALAELDRLRRG